MKVVVVVIAVLVTLGLAALGMVAAEKVMVPSSPSDHVAHLGSPDHGESAPATSARLSPIREIADSGSASASASAAAPVASVSAMQASSTAGPVTPERVVQNNAHSTLASATAIVSAEASSPTVNLATCDKAGGMGLSRIVEIDTTGGPGFGFEHFKQYDFLRPNEVMLTFDDGPWPENTPAVLKALADNVSRPPSSRSASTRSGIRKSPRR